MLVSENQLAIQAHHLARLAIIYLRKSKYRFALDAETLEGLQQQLRQRAGALGWAVDRVQVIDEDLGRSGAVGVTRYGFDHLLEDIAAGRVGAIFCWEASRLARSDSAWAYLIELASWMDTLIIDLNTIHDLTDLEDRALLEFKAVMARMELDWLRERLILGQRYRAQQGLLRFRPPVGFIYDEAHQLVQDPTPGVIATLDQFFQIFRETESIPALLTRFREQQRLVPYRPGRSATSEVSWVPLQTDLAKRLLRNPCYAGAYAYGRRHAQTQILENKKVQRYSRRANPDEWLVLLRDHHPGYITWADFEHNQECVQRATRVWSAPPRQRAATQAVLSGLVWCGHCYQPLVASWAGTSYEYQRRDPSGGKTQCPKFPGPPVEAAVEHAILAALEPAQIAIALAMQDQQDDQRRQEEEQWQAALQEARAEAVRAERRYKGVTLEDLRMLQQLGAEWNTALLMLQQREAAYTVYKQQTYVTFDDTERRQLQTIGREVAQIWHSAQVTIAQRQILLKLLLKTVVLIKQPGRVQILLRWQTDASTHLELPRPRRQRYKRTTLLARIRELAPDYTDTEIAHQLNREDRRPMRGPQFTRERVKSLRLYHQIWKKPRPADADEGAPA